MAHEASGLTIALVALHTDPMAVPGAGEAGGLNVYLLNSAKELARLGHRIHIVTRKDRRDLPEVEPIFDGVTAHYLEAGPREPVSKSDSERLIEPFESALDTWVQHSQVDIIHSHHWFAGVAAIPVANRHAIPHIQSYHSLAAPAGAGWEAGEKAESPGRIVGERQIAATSDLIIAVSEFEKNLIVSRYNADPANIAVASPGVDHVTFAPISEKETKPGHAGHRNSGASSARADGVQERVKGAEPSGANIPAEVSEPTIVFAGRIHPLKGADLVVRALSLMNPDSRPKLIISGEPASGYDDYLDEVRTLVTHLGTGLKVEFRPSLTREGLAELIGRSLFLINPSHLETYGIINVEAAACGVPVIATKTGGMVESVLDRQTGYLIDSRDPTEWARTMESLAHDPARRAELGAAGRRFALTRGWDNVARELTAIYLGEAG